MKRFIVILAAMAVVLNAMDFEGTKVETWRNGFIVAYKAMEVDTKTQGLENKEIPTRRYVIYFDARGDDIATWDKLMVQMFGYSSSVHKPVRTTGDLIIFESYDNKATALQELDILNDKIFKNSKKYRLQMMDNKEAKRFYSDKALLAENLTDLRKLFKEIERLKINDKSRELEENQKVAVVYVNNETGEIIDDVDQFKADIVDDVRKRQKREKLQLSDLEIRREKVKFKPLVGLYKPKKDQDVAVFSVPERAPSKKIRDAISGEVFVVEAADGYGWYKVKGKEEYVAGYLVTKATEPDLKAFQNKFTRIKNLAKEKEHPVHLNENTNEQPKPAPEEAVGEFMLVDDEAVEYRLKGFDPKTETYPIADFKVGKLMKNDYQKYSFSKIVKDSDGMQYLKIYGKNVFIPRDNLYILE